MKTSVLTLTVLLLCLTLAPAADWPQWRGPDHNGISKETNWDATALSRGPKLAWQAQIGKGFGSIAIAGGKVYASGSDGSKDHIICFAAADGKEAWRHSYACSTGGKHAGPRSTPTVDDGRVYSFSIKGHLHCLDAASGKVVWEKQVGKELGATAPRWGYAGSARVAGDLVLVNAGTSGTALDKKTGKIAWSSGTESAAYATPVVYRSGGKGVALIFSQKHLFAAGLADGKALWKFPWETDYDVNAADPIEFRGKIFISSGYGRGCALIDTAGGSPSKTWENKTICGHVGTAVLIDGHLYGFNGNAGKQGQLKCVEFDSGEEKWSQDMTFGTLIAAGTKLIILTETGELEIAEASPSGYKSLSKGKTPLTKRCWTAPALADGRIYSRSNDQGLLVCVDVSP